MMTQLRQQHDSESNSQQKQKDKSVSDCLQTPLVFDCIQMFDDAVCYLIESMGKSCVFTSLKFSSLFDYL